MYCSMLILRYQEKREQRGGAYPPVVILIYRERYSSADTIT